MYSALAPQLNPVSTPTSPHTIYIYINHRFNLKPHFNYLLYFPLVVHPPKTVFSFVPYLIHCRFSDFFNRRMCCCVVNSTWICWSEIFSMNIKNSCYLLWFSPLWRTEEKTLKSRNRSFKRCRSLDLRSSNFIRERFLGLEDYQR